MTSRLRRSLWFGAMSTALGMLATLTAWAQVERTVEERLLSSSRAVFEFLAPYEQAIDGAQSMLLSLNGVSVRVHSVGLDATETQVDDAFSQFEANCRTPKSGQNRDALVPPPVVLGRSAIERFGYCLKPHDVLDLDGIAALLEGFEGTGDLSSIGQFLGVYVRSAENHRRVLFFESVGAFHLVQAFPSHGDAPGRDHAPLPRPPGRRTLSAELNRRPILTAYESKEPRAALAAYQRTVDEQGIDVESESKAGTLRSLTVKADRSTYLVLPADRQLVLVRLP